MEVECMPPSQILKLKQALDLEPKEDLSQPVPLSRRSESKVAQIAKQIADAERERQKLEKAMARSGKSPKVFRIHNIIICSWLIYYVIFNDILEIKSPKKNIVFFTLF